VSGRAKLLCWLLATIPVYVLVGLIERYGVNVPYWDEWNWSVSRFLANDLPELRLGRFWALRAEHRVFVPQLVGTGLAHLTDLNMFANLYAKLGLSVVIFALLVRMYTRRAQAVGAPLIALVFSALVFSIVQWPRWIDPRPLPTTFAILGTVLTLSALCGGPPSRWRVAVAGAGAYLASLSYFSGNLTWLIGAGLLVCTGYRGLRTYGIWIAMTLTVWIPYAVDFWGSDSLARTTESPTIRQLGRFLLVFLGSPLVDTDPFVYGQEPAMALGVAGLGMCAVAALAAPRWIADGWRKCLPWLALAAWVVMSGAAAAYGRAGLGSHAARAERYRVYGSVFWIAVAALIAVALCEPWRKDRKGLLLGGLLLRLCPAVLAAWVCVGYVDASLAATAAGNFGRLPKLLIKGRDCLLTYETADDACLGLLLNHPGQLRSMLPELLRRRASFLFPEIELDQQMARVRGPRAGQTSPNPKHVAGAGRRVMEIAPAASVFWTELHLPHFDTIQIHTAFRVVPAPEVPAEEVEFKVELLQAGVTTELHRSSYRAADSFTPSVSIDLSPYAGRVIGLKFSNSGGSNATRAQWLYPRITYGGGAAGS
jgi:hypothetical protein